MVNDESAGKGVEAGSDQTCLNKPFNLGTASIKTSHYPSGAPRKHYTIHTANTYKQYTHTGTVKTTGDY